MAEPPVSEVEEWREIPGHSGYEASSLGRVRSLDRWIVNTRGQRRLLSGNVLRPNKNRRYQRVWLPEDNSALVHVIVCATFYGDRPSKYHHAAHWNGDAHDNRACNLRWATPEQNAADRVRHGKGYQGIQNGNAKLSEADIRAIRKLRATTGLSLQTISDRFGTDKGHIKRIVDRRSWAHLP
jgi:hypothetical protein